jgi:hypothetical protein
MVSFDTRTTPDDATLISAALNATRSAPIPHQQSYYRGYQIQLLWQLL